MFLYLRAHPGAEQRLGMLDPPLQALQAGDFSLLLGRGGPTCWLPGLLPGRGDRFLAYTLPGRPFFDPLTGALLAAGMLICLRRWRDPACALALVWFWVGIAPSLVTGPDASFTRSIAAMPVTCLFPARGVRRTAGTFAGRADPPAVAGRCSARSAGGDGRMRYRDYFLRWGGAPDVRAAYRNNLLTSVRWARDELGAGTAVFSTDYPLEPHDPYLGQLYLPPDRLAVRWVSGPGCAAAAGRWPRLADPAGQHPA